jgi:sarcosine oxidase
VTSSDARAGTDSATFDVAVVGMGLVGVGPGEPAVWHGHDGVFASHYDSGRITRKLDKRREWAILAARSIAEYTAIEEASAVQFHHPVGVVIADADSERLAATIAVAQALGTAFTVHDADQPFVDARLAVPHGATVLHEPAPGGFIDPRRMLAAQLTAARAAGATVVPERVDAIEQVADGWKVVTAGRRIHAGQVVVASGPHGDELPGLPRQPHLDVLGETVVLARLPLSEQVRLDRLPSVILDHPELDHLYMVPPTIYPDGLAYLKLGATHDPPRVLSREQRKEWMAGDAHTDDLDWLRGLMLRVVPGLDVEAWATKPCLIPETPTKLPYLEIIAEGCVVALGGNGYAAKSADAIGAIAAGLVIDRRWTDSELAEDDFRLISR